MVVSATIYRAWHTPTLIAADQVAAVAGFLLG